MVLIDTTEKKERESSDNPLGFLLTVEPLRGIPNARGGGVAGNYKTREGERGEVRE